MGSRFQMGLRRSWWIFLLYGLLAIVFGVALLLWPTYSVMALVMAFGVLSLADGVVSLASAIRRDLALPRWLLAAYALVSIGFGIAAFMWPVQLATAMLWVIALWLILAGIARIVFAIQVRKLIRGEWLLALSGVLALALGILFLARPDIGLVAISVWVGIGALFYGALQILVGMRMRSRARLTL
ncbi:MAG TPA: DUF308 domain-containing protein [Candidatus Luteimonas excrementigallinarum]|nr:DUF308 domain-containing protein [Candidatus Luteimonas excrementigallinarum]